MAYTTIDDPSEYFNTLLYTGNETARALNKETESPFHNRLKMLGKKTEGQELASLSQGTFIKYMLELISKKPDIDTRDIKNGIELEKDERCVLRDYFINEKDDVIYKILLNLYSGVRDAFTLEWDNPNDFIISKPIGFGAIIKAFPIIYKQGVEEKKLSREFFKNIFDNFKISIEEQDIQLTSDHFGSNEQARTKHRGRTNDTEGDETSRGGGTFLKHFGV